MNVSKNYSKPFLWLDLSRLSRYGLLICILLVISFDLGAAETQTNPSSAIEFSDYLKVVFGLIFVIGLFLTSTFLFKRFGNGPMLGRGELRVVDGLHLGNRERLMLVELKGKQILLAITPGNISKLDTIDTIIPNDERLAPGLESVRSTTSANQIT